MEFRALVEDSLTSAFETLVEMPPQDGSPSTDNVSNAAMIGFVGEHVRGTLGVAVSGPTLRDLAVRLGAPEIEGGPEDALGELANLLLGHVTRAWAHHHIEVTIGTPLVVAGAPTEIQPCDTRQFQTSALSGNKHCVVWLDARVSPDLEVAT
ncbi:MAG: chemotaxis protein CheX [bacterium]|nr:chemotaxis protein CheX [bacterium]